MKRTIFKQLEAWKNKKHRKPLIIKGVRQSGKTYILKEFGRTIFPNFHYVNFEENLVAHELFKQDLDPNRILTDLQFLFDKPIDHQNDLIIFDEIQACPAALTSVKYFSEKMPHVALCCAGSLLGLHLNEGSFPVGKVDLLHMWPMCFAEFLMAINDEKSLEVLHQAFKNFSISTIAHHHLWEQFKHYLIVGGLPEVVSTYCENKNDIFNAFSQVRIKQNELITGYYADFAKHAGKVNAMHIDRIWRAIPSQLARHTDGTASRFQFKGVVPGIDRYQRLASAIDWLKAAELLIKVHILDHVELPLMAYAKESHFKLYMFDVGILNALADLPPKAILDYNFGTYKGYYAENFVAQELISKEFMNLYSWEHNRAEVEFLIVQDSQIIPIEVKSGWVQNNQSLNKFVEKYNSPCRVVLSARPLNFDRENRYYQYPIYMAYWLPEKLL